MIKYLIIRYHEQQVFWAVQDFMLHIVIELKDPTLSFQEAMPT